MKRSLPIHPFLLAIFPILFLFAHNAGELWFSDIRLAAALALGFTLALLLLAWLSFKDRGKAGLLVSAFGILFYSYGRVYGAVEGWQAGGLLLGRHRFLLLAWGLLFLGAAVALARTRRDLNPATRLLNAITIVLVALPLANLATRRIQASRPAADRVAPGAEPEPAAAVAAAGMPLRDIYYIILDGYASAHALQEFYQYDNGEFVGELTRRGFYVAADSRCNYVTTFLSLASSLNMEYVNYLADAVGADSKDRTVPYQMIDDNRVQAFLRQQGYRIVHFSSGWGATDRNPHADLHFSSQGVNEFHMVLIRTTLLRPFEDRLVGDDARTRVLYTFAKLAEMPRLRGPKFVFAHINSPHPPYLFGANGEPVPQARLEMDGYVWADKENYLNQLKFISAKTLELVDRLLAESDPAPIVILQADHGTASAFTHPDAGGWEQPTDAMKRERAQIFNAYYLPGGGPARLYPGISPVNTFRLVFNAYFNAGFELREDRCYYSTYGLPLQFSDVTDAVQIQVHGPK